MPLPHAQLAAQLRAVVPPLDRQLRQQSSDGLTPTQRSVFGTIFRQGPITIGDLAASERLSTPTVSKAVASLEASAYIERLADPTDRRVCRVVAARAGRLFVKSNQARRDEWLSDRIDALDEEQRAILIAAVPVLEQILADGDE